MSSKTRPHILIRYFTFSSIDDGIGLHGKPCALKEIKDDELLKVASAYGLGKVDDLMSGIGYGKYSARQVLARLLPAGTTPSIAGDIAAPEPWAARLPPLDAVIHAACDFNTGMGATDRHLLDVLLPALAAQPKRPRFIYTGGCWLFGATGDDVATEQTSFRPLPAFAWMVPQLQRILEAPEIEGIVIHPAMAYTPGGGVFLRFAQEAVEREAIRVVGSESVRWPLVHSEDLATLYALALEQAAARRLSCRQNFATRQRAP